MTSVMDLELAELILPVTRLKVRILNWPILMADSAESARIPLIRGRFLIILVHYNGIGQNSVKSARHLLSRGKISENKQKSALLAI